MRDVKMQTESREVETGAALRGHNINQMKTIGTESNQNLTAKKNQALTSTNSISRNTAQQNHHNTTGTQLIS